jgi:hypothetical protein
MLTKKFKKTIENFVCEKCGEKIKGNGYTNHCPKCLWSKHVDINPGDRAEKCGGMMAPVRVEKRKGKYVIVHQCVECCDEKRKVADKKDNFDAILAIAKKNSE